MDVRPARLDDLYDLVQCSLGVARESEGLEPDPDVVRDSIHAALQDLHKARYFVAEEDGRTIGCLFVTFEWSDWTAGWYWWIQGAYVQPGHRGRGVFRAMYDAVHAAAAREGDVRRIRLYVEGDNDTGLQTYRALGMHETGYRIFDAPIAAVPSTSKGRPGKTS